VGAERIYGIRGGTQVPSCEPSEAEAIKTLNLAEQTGENPDRESEGE
jgi:hypothetical protein